MKIRRSVVKALLLAGGMLVMDYEGPPQPPSLTPEEFRKKHDIPEDGAEFYALWGIGKLVGHVLFPKKTLIRLVKVSDVPLSSELYRDTPIQDYVFYKRVDGVWQPERIVTAMELRNRKEDLFFFWCDVTHGMEWADSMLLTSPDGEPLTELF